MIIAKSGRMYVIEATINEHVSYYYTLQYANYIFSHYNTNDGYLTKNNFDRLI